MKTRSETLATPTHFLRKCLKTQIAGYTEYIQKIGYIQFGLFRMKSSSDTLRGTEPKYVWFAGYLRRQIEDGTLKPGDRLPSRTEIRERHQLAQPTVERAQAILEREGLIVRRERSGIFVADPVLAGKNGEKDLSHGTARISLGTIGILTTNDGEVNPKYRQFGWSDYITQGALEGCRKHNKHALLLNISRLQGEELKQLLTHPPLGFVFSSITSGLHWGRLEQMLHSLRRSKRPVVVFGNDPEFSAFDRVACDHEQGCYELTRWLIGRGCRRILPFWPPVHSGASWIKDRLAGYRRAMREAELEPLPVREVPSNRAPFEPEDTREKFDVTTRYKAGYLADYLGRQLKCDAILDITDGEVSTTAAACRLLGHEPNRDVLIAGYDNYWPDSIERAFESTIPIATVDKHNWQIGQALVDVLLARVAGELGEDPHLRFVSTELIPLADLALSA